MKITWKCALQMQDYKSIYQMWFIGQILMYVNWSTIILTWIWPYWGKNK